MSRLPVRWLTLCAAFGVAAAAAGAESTDALARYRQERAVCTSGKSNQDLPTCLREASAALQASRQTPAAATPPDTIANQQKRCAVLRDEEARDCVARMSGQGTKSGSVASGGILRELVTVDAAASAASAPSR